MAKLTEKDLLLPLMKLALFKPGFVPKLVHQRLAGILDLPEAELRALEEPGPDGGPSEMELLAKTAFRQLKDAGLVRMAFAGRFRTTLQGDLLMKSANPRLALDELGSPAWPYGRGGTGRGTWGWENTVGGADADGDPLAPPEGAGAAEVAGGPAQDPAEARRFPGWPFSGSVSPGNLPERPRVTAAVLYILGDLKEARAKAVRLRIFDLLRERGLPKWTAKSFNFEKWLKAGVDQSIHHLFDCGLLERVDIGLFRLSESGAKLRDERREEIGNDLLHAITSGLPTGPPDASPPSGGPWTEGEGGAPGTGDDGGPRGRPAPGAPPFPVWNPAARRPGWPFLQGVSSLPRPDGPRVAAAVLSVMAKANGAKIQSVSGEVLALLNEAGFPQQEAESRKFRHWLSRHCYRAVKALKRSGFLAVFGQAFTGITERGLAACAEGVEEMVPGRPVGFLDGLRPARELDGRGAWDPWGALDVYCHALESIAFRSLSQAVRALSREALSELTRLLADSAWSGPPGAYRAHTPGARNVPGGFKEPGGADAPYPPPGGPMPLVVFKAGLPAARVELERAFRAGKAAGAARTVFFSPNGFDPAALDYARSLAGSLYAADGPAMAKLMLELGIGTEVFSTVERKAPDPTFFSMLEYTPIT
ncbi:MAG: hypothetical protein LBQ12_16025 [Deltaproteobacteria bacterium]|jgi:hypothetical protein|nr:hypothetical protein [Deltaproteobacteria bacterium]